VSIVLSLLIVFTALALVEHRSIRVYGAEKQTIYIDTSGIDRRTDLSDQEKNELKTKILNDIKRNFEEAVGAGKVEVTNNQSKKRTAIRKVRILNQFDPDRRNPGYGAWPHGSDIVNVYLKEFMDDPAVKDAFKTSGKWDTTKLANAIGHTCAHELGHSFSVGHNKKKGSDLNKMTKGGLYSANDKATREWHFDEHSKKTIKKNWGKKPCRSATDYEKKALILDYYWSDLSYTYKPEETGSVDVYFTFIYSSLARYFYFGILGFDSDNGTLDGDPRYDFIYKSSMEGLGADAEMLTFFVNAHNYTQFLLLGAPESPYAGTWFPLDEANLELIDLIEQPDGDLVARTVEMKWYIEGPEPDVVVCLTVDDSYDAYSGFRYDYPTPVEDIVIVAVDASQWVVWQYSNVLVNIDVTLISSIPQPTILIVEAINTKTGVDVLIGMRSVDVLYDRLVTIEWNNTYLDIGNYTIYAYTYTTNKYIDSWVIVDIAGDVNLDWKVDMKDIVSIVNKFATTPLDPEWNQIYDINNDQRVDMRDIIIVIIHFGQVADP